MRSIVKNLPLVLAAALFTLIAHAQAAPKPDAAPKPSNSPSKVLLDSWNDVGRKLIAMAEDFPEDKYDFKPNPAQRSFAEQLLHAAVNVNYFVNNLAKGTKPPTGDVRRTDYTTKAAVVKYVNKSFAEGAALIKSKGDGGMSDLCIDPFTNQQDRFLRPRLGLYRAFRRALRTACGLLPCGRVGAAGVAQEKITARKPKPTGRAAPFKPNSYKRSYAQPTNPFPPVPTRKPNAFESAVIKTFTARGNSTARCSFYLPTQTI